MSELDSLYRAILASPDEATSRLAYADELEATDPARAEFIRIDCELSLTKANPPKCIHAGTVHELTCADLACPLHLWTLRAADLQERRAELLRENRKRWEVAGPHRRFVWSIGFLSVTTDSMSDCWQQWHTEDPVSGEIYNLRWVPTRWLQSAVRAHVVSVMPARLDPANLPPPVLALYEPEVMFRATHGREFISCLGLAVVRAALDWMDSQTRKDS